MCEHAIACTGAHIADTRIVELGAGKKLSIITVHLHGTRGIVLHYENPPVHHIDTRALDGYAEALEIIEHRKDEFSFLIFSFAPDSVHAGGDLKETLANLYSKSGYMWADRRLLKAFALYKRVRALAKHLRVVSILSGGVYYGGSAEIALWADYMIGDSRSSICMSEATIGLIPGWGGFVRLSRKAGQHNARCLVATARKITAHELKSIGILTTVADVDSLFAHAFKIATREAEDAPKTHRIELMSEEDMEAEISKRSDPRTYSHLCGKSLVEVREEIAELKMPLAPQSIRALRALFVTYNIRHEEEHLYHTELACDAALYRNPLLAEGIQAVLQKRVPNFSLKGGISS